MARWKKQAAQRPRGISIAGGEPVPKPTGKGATPLLPDAVRAFLATLERTHASIAVWLPTIDAASAQPAEHGAEHTRASLAIMVEANSLTDAIKALAEATQVDAQNVGDARRATAFANIRKAVKQHV